MYLSNNQSRIFNETLHKSSSALCQAISNAADTAVEGNKKS